MVAARITRNAMRAQRAAPLRMGQGLAYPTRPRFASSRLARRISWRTCCQRWMCGSGCSRCRSRGESGAMLRPTRTPRATPWTTLPRATLPTRTPRGMLRPTPPMLRSMRARMRVMPGPCCLRRPFRFASKGSWPDSFRTTPIPRRAQCPKGPLPGRCVHLGSVRVAPDMKRWVKIDPAQAQVKVAPVTKLTVVPSFCGNLDQVFVFFGHALGLAEIRQVQSKN